jgi:light-regulated signal transduction histidine kinase (bacteriophytochrome)
MSELIGDMLSLSRVTRVELHRKNVNLSTIAKDVINTLQKIEPKRSVRIAIQENVFANCDPGLMKIVMENLLSNSWKFTRRKEDPMIGFGVDFKEDNAIYYVRDNGAGFDMKFIERLFKPFHRLHSESEFEGTGVGLATVYRIIKKHGGDIWADAIKNKGATFYFTLQTLTSPLKKK